MTKSERETANLIREHIDGALKLLESGRIGEGVDWILIVRRLADKLTETPKKA
ncbi:hypothetical protein [Trabulsiella odontotermitis]|uniref:hypothetical protein n=1 Tax=Trabulsiella odontotermitis TaxID=379893 RepID=UPI000ABCA9B0|nr:hypothetical protein [Trabulsiella odontotermitis]